MSVCPPLEGHEALGRDVCCKWFRKRSKTHSVVESQRQQPMMINRGRRVTATEGRVVRQGWVNSPACLSASFLRLQEAGRAGYGPVWD